MTGKEAFLKYGKILDILSIIYKILPRAVRLKLFQMHRNTNGKIGLAVRYALIKGLAKSVGTNVSILPGCYFKYLENLDLGNNVSINPMCFIGCAGGVSIGDNVSIAHGSTILSTSHTYEELETPIKYQSMSLKNTKIDENVWIGCGVTILAGVQISSGCVIGANSVVTKDIEKNSIAVGSPAKIVKKRD